jgi:hypothetical protein
MDNIPQDIFASFLKEKNSGANFFPIKNDGNSLQRLTDNNDMY